MEDDESQQQRRLFFSPIDPLCRLFSPGIYIVATGAYVGYFSCILS